VLIVQRRLLGSSYVALLFVLRWAVRLWGMNSTLFIHRPAEKLLQQPTRTTDTAASKEHKRPDPAWARPALIALLLLTALAYTWDLSASGYANSFYAAAVQAGTKSWKTMFFGSLDSSNFITVDKPPASLWVMALSGRLFGFSSWSMLVPQALEGVAAVALLHAAVKRWFRAGAGLIAGSVFALTPVAALMFRFNNPDALLVLLMVAGAYCLIRALEHASTRWVLAAGTMIGFAFLAKMMQAFIVLPAFASVYAVTAPTGLRRRLGQIFAGGVAVLVSAGWWVAIVALWPVGSRPMIDGSPDNSIINLIFGYNGLSRVFGGGTPGGGGSSSRGALASAAGRGGAPGGGGANFSGPAGIFRLFNNLMGGQASWLLPAALICLAAGLWTLRSAPRTDRTRAALLLWGGWLIVTAIVFSFGQGVIHTYYTVALAPAIGAVIGIGAYQIHIHRHTRRSCLLAAMAVGSSATWAYVLLDRTPHWLPWLRVAILVLAMLAIAGLLLAATRTELRSRLLVVAAVLGAGASIAGPLAYAADTITTPHTGSIPSAGPANSGSGPGGAPGGGMGFGPGGATHGGGPVLFGSSTQSTGAAGAPPSEATGAGVSGRSTGFPGPGDSSSGRPGGGTGSGQPGAGGGAQVSAKLKTLLESGASRYRWVAATSGSQSAASIELATGEAVMAIGGFNGEGGRLSLAAFESYVRAGDVHYYMGGGRAGTGPGGNSQSSEAIANWVAVHFKSVTVGEQTVYDLTL
jgi:4-amino-4-deoxy-L-arabinose transferase-like glycosyltransferase